MDTLRLQDLRRLLAPREGHLITLYLPTHVGGIGGEEDEPRLMHLLERAEADLVKHGMRSPDARELLSAAHSLPADKAFWKQRQAALALFVAADYFQAFRLPYDLPEALHVGRRFCIKPLLPLLAEQESFYILALSQNRVRLLLAGAHFVEELESPGLDHSLRELLNETAGKGQQVHAAASLGAAPAASRKQAAVFHGQGGYRDTAKQDITRYFRLVDETLHDSLREQQTPLVLAGVEYLLPLYREVCTYPHVLDEAVTGNCEHLRPHEIRERAWPLVKPHLDAERLRIAERYARLKGTRTALTETGAIVRAANAGQVAALFVDPRHEVWGEFDAQTGETSFPEARGGEDLIELAVAQTLLKRGKVYALDGDDRHLDRPISALLRY